MLSLFPQDVYDDILNLNNSVSEDFPIYFCACPSFPFGIEGRMLVVIVLIPDHFLSIYFSTRIRTMQYYDELIKRMIC